MNRQQRRAEARASRVICDRTDVLALAAGVLAGTTDPTVTGATLILPDGETMYLDRETFRPAQNDGAQH